MGFFRKEGAKRTILGKKFSTNTENEKTGLLQEASICTIQIQDYNGTITSLNQQRMERKCVGPWGSIIVVAENLTRNIFKH